MRRLETLVPVAQGACGRVYRARDAETGELVAVKQLRRQGPAQLERLRREAAVQQRLEHPNICRVLAFEQNEEGTWQLLMEYVAGSTLARELGSLGLRERVRILAGICDAVAAAHAAGIVHRDLKPANILLRRAEYGWEPVVADFGLARGDEDPVMTATGEVHGTPAYMAPEQARGERQTVGPATDLFAIGCMLYEFQTGEPPFAGPTVSATLDRLLHQDAAHPRRTNPHAPEALCRIALQCIESDPRRRYRSAAAIRRDLLAWLDGERVAARRYGPVPLQLRRLRRHPLITLGAGAGMALVLALASWAIVSTRAVAERERTAARLTETVTDIRGQMTVARLAPLHDIAEDRARVRARLDLLAQERAARSGIRDLVEAALAEAFLELGELERAEVHAERALAHRATPRTRALRAETLLRRYSAVIEPALGLPAEQRDERLQSARARYVDAANALLAAGAEEGPASTLARLAILEGRFDEAANLIAALTPDGPGDYRAALLAAELHLARAETALEGGDAPRAQAGFEAAGRAFATVATIGRSDPEPLLGRCRAARGSLRARAALGGDFPESLAALEPGCAALPEVDSGSARSFVGQAAALTALAAALDGVNDRDQARALTREGLAATAAALEREPGDSAALEYAARLHHRLAGLDPEPPELAAAHFEHAVAAASRFRAAVPGNPAGPLLVGLIERDRARHASLHGRDPIPAFDAAAAALDAALTLAPDSPAALEEAALNAIFRFYEERPRAPEEALAWARRAIALQDRVLALRPGAVDALFDQGANHGDLWHYLLLTPDLAPELDRSSVKADALSLLERMRVLAPRRPDGYAQAIMIELTHADLLSDHGRDPRVPVASASRLYREALAAGVTFARNLRGWLRLSEVRAALVAGRDATAAFAAAWEVVDDAEEDPADLFFLRLHELELAGLQARWLRQQGSGDPGPVLDRGRAALDALLAADRRQAGVLCGGARVLLEGGLTDGSLERTEARAARELLDACFAKDPDFEAGYDEDLALIAAANEPP